MNHVFFETHDPRQFGNDGFGEELISDDVLPDEDEFESDHFDELLS